MMKLFEILNYSLKINLKSLFRGLFTFLLLVGCANKAPHSSLTYVSKEIKNNIGSGITTKPVYGDGQIPYGISLEQGLDEQKAVAIALWNNAAFHADLAQLGVSRAEVLQAGLLKNPNFSLLFPIGPKQLEARVAWALSELQVRPHRMAIAKLDASRVADNLIQNGLNLARDTQVAFSNLLHAQKASFLAKENAHLISKISKITQKRFQLGDINELEAHLKEIDALNALDQSNRLAYDEKIFRNRLLSFLGIESQKKLKLIPSSYNSNHAKTLTSLLDIAFSSRPDFRIAELEIESAGEQIGWEESKIFNFIGILDANEINTEVGPGLNLDIPVFNQNEGGIARAKAQLNLAVKRYLAIREKIKLSVEESYSQYHASRQRLELVTQKILPQQEQRLKISNQALEKGEISYLLNLEAQRDFIQAKLRELEVLAELWRNTAQLGHSIGRPVEFFITHSS